MPNPSALLRQILSSRLDVTVESDSRLIRSVQESIDRRTRVLARKGLTVPFKPPQVVATFAKKQSWTIRPIDLLRKIGQMTVPPFLPLEKLPRLSASWATRRYFWAIQPSPNGIQGPFRLSPEARELDFHQKTLLSDEFGIGMAGLLMENYFGAPKCTDISYALRSAGDFQNVSLTERASPDYLVSGPGKTYYVVECKGCQTTRSVAINQIRRGLEQVISVNFGPGPYRSETFVVATFLDKSRTRVFVVDPPSDEDPHDDEVPKKRRILNIKDPELFARHVTAGDYACLLAWAGLYGAASGVFKRFEVPMPETQLPPDRPRHVRKTSFGEFEGTISPLFPELGNEKVTLFTGVRPDLVGLKDLAPKTNDKADAPGNEAGRLPHDLPSNMSVGKNGTCMIVDGI